MHQALLLSRNKTLKRKKKKLDEYCLFFNRFGRCEKGEAGCPYLHDPEKVAVCRLFLKGTCTGKGDLSGGGSSCLLSHAVAQDKMPTCAFFLKGTCTKEDCPYSHVKVNEKAEVCPAFLKGFCPQGKACQLRHVLEKKKKRKKEEEKGPGLKKENGEEEEMDMDTNARLDKEVQHLLSES